MPVHAPVVSTSSGEKKIRPKKSTNLSRLHLDIFAIGENVV
jgi:hypothetical protein